ncbi:hypothetical protein NDU88_003100 [Pleurodeles waltl]|uniref:Uncharacterized protein n=1 Tax=Pleurodeles waltl TaxID=8319 RepID=A0AAV7QES9_PLEWA|nr:hypothetical protein NDU88_003100 [Pleurodeles waltl]
MLMDTWIPSGLKLSSSLDPMMFGIEAGFVFVGTDACVDADVIDTKVLLVPPPCFGLVAQSGSITFSALRHARGVDQNLRVVAHCGLDGE